MSCKQFFQKERKRKQKGLTAAGLIFLVFTIALILTGCSRDPFGFLPKGEKEKESSTVSSEAEAKNSVTFQSSHSEVPDEESGSSSEDFIFPEYSGEPYVVLNNNVPGFTEEDLVSITGENYSDLDPFGRCGKAEARLERSMMPGEDRGEIGEIRPSGWNQEKYPGLVDSEPPFLYNRCHLIAYGLTGQNANEKNLITGTRYLNVEGMLPFERQVIYHLYRPGVHVLYRVIPRFYGDELVARGVEMEAFSIEDDGAGLSFHVYVFNVQPGVEIDYADGSSRRIDEFQAENP